MAFKENKAKGTTFPEIENFLCKSPEESTPLTLSASKQEELVELDSASPFNIQERRKSINS